MPEQLTFKETFEAAEQARIQGDYDLAIALYAIAAASNEEISTANETALHHMWGVALLGTNDYAEANQHFELALDTAQYRDQHAAILRDCSRGDMLNGDLERALEMIEVSLSIIRHTNFAERGASLGFQARILLERGEVIEALEIFGTADILLQRSDNRHYELYNLLHFLEAITGHRMSLEEFGGERDFARAQTPRLRALAETFGGPPHRDRAKRIANKIFTEREA